MTMAKTRKVLKIGKLAKAKDQFAVVMINNHSEVVTKEVADELKQLRWMLGVIRSILLTHDF